MAPTVLEAIHLVVDIALGQRVCVARAHAIGQADAAGARGRFNDGRPDAMPRRVRSCRRHNYRIVADMPCPARYQIRWRRAAARPSLKTVSASPSPPGSCSQNDWWLGNITVRTGRAAADASKVQDRHPVYLCTRGGGDIVGRPQPLRSLVVTILRAVSYVGWRMWHYGHAGILCTRYRPGMR